MDADGLEELEGGISGEEGHKHMLQNRLFVIHFKFTSQNKENNKERLNLSSSYLITFSFNHQGIWHQ